MPPDGPAVPVNFLGGLLFDAAALSANGLPRQGAVGSVALRDGALAAMLRPPCEAPMLLLPAVVGLDLAPLGAGLVAHGHAAWSTRPSVPARGRRRFSTTVGRRPPSG